MRLVLSVCIVLCLGTKIQAQVDWNFFAGPQASTAHYLAKEVKQKTQFKYGFMAGLGLKVPIENTISFVPQLFYSMKGYKVKYTEYLSFPEPNATSNDTRIHTLETAFLMQFDFNAQPAHAYFRTGPSLDFQLFGHEDLVVPAGSISRKMKYGYQDYGHYAANWLLHLGYESSNDFFIYASFSHGLTNLSNFDDGPKIRHEVFGITIGKFFKRSKLVMDTRNKE